MPRKVCRFGLTGLKGATLLADSSSATVTRNVARNNFKGGHTVQLFWP